MARLRGRRRRAARNRTVYGSSMPSRGSSFARVRPGTVMLVAAWVAVIALSANCTPDAAAPAPRTIERTGGTLRVGLVGEDSASGWCPLLLCGQTYDPQSTTFVDVFELNRCCFMRTLLTYNGGSVEQGGTVVRPDLASSLPAVSADGLTWTFHLRSGVHYAPPLEDTEIVADDFIRSFERSFSSHDPGYPWAEGSPLGGYWTSAYLLDVIAGARAFFEGDADHVTGLEAPDPHTLVVHLTKPVGDLPDRVALTGFGPIPANPARPDDPFGVAQGHDFDYGDYIVSSGPYMFAGSGAMDFSRPAEDQLPPTGNGVEMATLVRNPSWSSADDPVRQPRPDRIVFVLVPNAEDAEPLVRSGALDIVMNANQAPTEVAKWLENPELRDRVTVVPSDFTRFLFINVALPPFDDVHVRRAMNLLMDREAIARAMEDGGSQFGEEPFTHLALDSDEDNLLLSYAPPGVTSSGDLSAAKAEMRSSAYDSDGDGRCDAAVCSDIALNVRASTGWLHQPARIIVDALTRIGIGVQVHPLSDDKYFASFDPKKHLALDLTSWGKDYPNASTFFPPLLGSEFLGTVNQSMFGASPAQLRKYGYTVPSVPDLDPRLDACLALYYEAQTRCWAQLDQYLSEEVVPWIPLTSEQVGWLVSDRVGDVSIDASDPLPLPAIERLSVDGSAAAPLPVPVAPSDVPEIANGMYRTTISIEDIVAAGGPSNDIEDAGTFTVVLRDGWFWWHQGSDHPISNPVSAGTYTGTGDDVTFHITAPTFGADDLSRLRWEMDGDALVFTLPECTGPAAHAPDFCAFQTALFTAHPWERVGSA
jgi:peptide/nickel transport system substrate-binding protein